MDDLKSVQIFIFVKREMEKQIKIGDSVYVLSSNEDYLLAMGNDFEPYMVQLFGFLINPDDVVADIGANNEVPRLADSATRLQQYFGLFFPIPMERTFRWMLET